jgi:hypothetical protein
MVDTLVFGREEGGGGRLLNRVSKLILLGFVKNLIY